LLVTVVMASGVDAVEAMTVILASGITRGWRSTVEGIAVAFILLAAVVAILGRALVIYVPINVLRLVVGWLLLVFGLQWLCQSVLRASGVKPRHSEALHYKEEIDKLANAPSFSHQKRDPIAFALSFKGVLLEGTEVVIIVISFGVQSGQMLLCIIGAVVTIFTVGLIAIALARPLTKIPQNYLQLAVGLMLTTFGTFWMGEGAGIRWPGADAYLLILIATFAMVSFILFIYLRRKIQASLQGNKI
jgi:uncharacterized membrane protein